MKIPSGVLHAIVSHDEPRKPLTIEAGIVQIADALDMEKGRAKIPFQSGKVDIQEGDKMPVVIKITMSNSAGIFQIDELLKPRIESSGLKNYIHVVAQITQEKETKILDKFEI